MLAVSAKGWRMETAFIFIAVGPLVVLEGAVYDLSPDPEPKNGSLKDMPSDDAWLSDKVSERIKHMVTWQLVAELMRRHRPRIDLRVFELHPGGGMGDSLYLYKLGRNGLEKVNDLRGFRRMGDYRPHRDLDDGGAYVWPWLRAEDPKVIVDAVEELCGFPPCGPPDNQQSRSTWRAKGANVSYCSTGSHWLSGAQMVAASGNGKTGTTSPVFWHAR